MQVRTSVVFLYVIYLAWLSWMCKALRKSPWHFYCIYCRLMVCSTALCFVNRKLDCILTLFPIYAQQNVVESPRSWPLVLGNTVKNCYTFWRALNTHEQLNTLVLPGCMLRYVPLFVKDCPTHSTTIIVLLLQFEYHIKSHIKRVYHSIPWVEIISLHSVLRHRRVLEVLKYKMKYLCVLGKWFSCLHEWEAYCRCVITQYGCCWQDPHVIVLLNFYMDKIYSLSRITCTELLSVWNRLRMCLWSRMLTSLFEAAHEYLKISSFHKNAIWQQACRDGLPLLRWSVRVPRIRYVWTRTLENIVCPM